MFEIPDDDEHLFDDIPLDDITNKKAVDYPQASSRPQLRVPESHCTGNATRQLYPGDSREHREFDSSPDKHVVTKTSKHPTSSGTTVSLNETNVSFNSNRRSTDAGFGTPVVSTRTVSVTKASENAGQPSIVTLAGSGADYITPKRKRKFPGPAGLLPEQGKNLNVKSLALPNNRTLQDSFSEPEGREPVIPSSQSSEDIFNDVPWQALLTDLADDGLKLMKKFSIGSTLLKAGKKQLYQGKAVLLCGVIEMIESHGSEASITLRDKSGKMQGTVHRDLLQEYEVELQIGTVLVLKQVSIISLSNRNHYLNITPANLVCLYHGKQDKLTTLKFHGSQESLHSVLAALEKKAASRRSMDASLTPRSSTGSSAPSLTGRSSTGTPMLPGSFPTTPDLNQRLGGRPGTPYSANTSSRLATPAGVRDVSLNTSSRLTTPAGVRDVSIVNPGSVSVTPSGLGRSSSDGQMVAPGGRLSSLLSSKKFTTQGANTSLNTQTSSRAPNTLVNRVPNTPVNTGVFVSSNSMNSVENGSNSSRSDDSGIIGRSVQNSSETTPQVGSSSWSFKKTSSAGQQPVVAVPGSNSSNRSCQLLVSNNNVQNTDSNCQTGSKSKWSFKSKTSTSPNSGTGTPVVLPESPAPATSKTVGKTTVPVDDLWDDDLNDDILSQLSDDMI